MRDNPDRKSEGGAQPSTPDDWEDVNLSHFLRAFFDQVPAILYIKDEFGRYVKINPHCERTFGVTDDQARGRTDDDFFPAEVAEEYRANDRLVLKTGTFHTFEERSIVNGEEITFLARKFRVSDERNEMHYICGISTDITALKQAEHKLAATTAAAEKASRAKSQFLAAVSHDLRQPIQAASLFLGVLEGRITDARTHSILERVKTSIGAVHTMLGTLLDLSRLDADLIQPTPAPVALSDVLDRLHAEFAPQAEMKGLKMRTIRCGAVVCTDSGLLVRILRNLLANAVTHTVSGRILVGCRHIGGNVRVEIADTGPGIPEAQQQHIFEEFYQISNPERDRSRGFGLGLAIVRRIAEMLGHTVAVRSVEGKGSVFSITIPLADPLETPGAHSADAGCETEDPMEGQLVLLIEDNPEVMGALSMLLEEWGLRVVSAGSMIELAERMAALTTPPALIIADYRLPGGATGANAVAFARAQIAPSLPAIILTGDTAPERLREARANDTRLLHKPVQIGHLYQIVRELLGGK